MHLFVSDSREQLAIGLCSRGKDHLKGIVNVWDTALSCADEGKVQGLLKKEYTILPGEAKFAWRLNKYAPWLLRRITDRQYEEALRELEKVP